MAPPYPPQGLIEPRHRGGELAPVFAQAASPAWPPGRIRVGRLDSPIRQ